VGREGGRIAASGEGFPTRFFEAFPRQRRRIPEANAGEAPFYPSPVGRFYLSGCGFTFRGAVLPFGVRFFGKAGSAVFFVECGPPGGFNARLKFRSQPRAMAFFQNFFA
jgi:hypothetical protein